MRRRMEPGLVSQFPYGPLSGKATGRERTDNPHGRTYGVSGVPRVSRVRLGTLTVRHRAKVPPGEATGCTPTSP